MTTRRQEAKGHYSSSWQACDYSKGQEQLLFACDGPTRHSTTSWLHGNRSRTVYLASDHAVLARDIGIERLRAYEISLDITHDVAVVTGK